MRLDHHGSKQEYRDSVQDLAYQRRSTILATSEELHTHRKVPPLRSFGSQVRDDKSILKGDAGRKGSNREIHS
jgi:hypothetical protein